MAQIPSIVAPLPGFPAAAIALVVIAAALTLYLRIRRPKSPPFPVVMVEKSLGDRDVFDAIRRGSKTYPSEPFKLVDPPLAIVILPESAISEFKDVSSDVASFRNFLYVYWQGKYSYIGQYSHALESAIKTGMNRDINSQLSTLAEETNFAVGEMIGALEDWREVQLSTTFTRIIAYITFRSFVGLPLSRDATWIEATTKYAATLGEFSAAVREWHWALRWLAAPVYWYLSVRIHQQRFIDMLAPIVRVAKQSKRSSEKGMTVEPPKTLVEWMISYNKTGDVSASKITGAQLTASFAAIHSTTGLFEHVLLDLASRPEDVRVLREELTDCAPDGKLDKVAMAKLWKLDSFIKESQRCNPATAFHMLRLSSATVKLRDFPAIPAGTNIAVSAAATSRIDSYNNQSDFDGFRHARMRSAQGSENRHQFVTTGPNATSFGHGPHACPGRYFASNEIKVLVAYLITRYDMKIRDDGKRPANVILPGGAVFPDPQACIMFKERSLS